MAARGVVRWMRVASAARLRCQCTSGPWSALRTRIVRLTVLTVGLRGHAHETRCVVWSCTRVYHDCIFWEVVHKREYIFTRLERARPTAFFSRAS